MKLIYISLEEKCIIKDHLQTLITTPNNNNNILDCFWKNWYQVFKDYQYVIKISQKYYNNKVLNSGLVNIMHYDVTNDKYMGLSFYHYFNYINKLKEYFLHHSNNTYLGQNGIEDNNIKGNEKYEVFVYTLYILI